MAIVQPRFAQRLVVCCLICAPFQPAFAPPINNDITVLCNANDPELLGNVMAYQVPVPIDAVEERLFVRRLVPDPPLADIRQETVFDGAEVDLDGGLPRLEETRNGPELGIHVEGSPPGGQFMQLEVAYTKKDSANPDNWFVVRQANACFQQFPLCWERLEFPNANPALENRWNPFVTTFPQVAKVLYRRDLDDSRESYSQIWCMS
jgi:hypothetical protein